MIEYLDIGKIINTHGVRGEVKVLPLTDDVSRYQLLKEVIIERKGKMEQYAIDSVRVHKGNVLLKLKGVDNMEQAELLRNAVLKVHRNDAVKLPKDSYFICDIIGLNVFDSKGQALGAIKDVLKTGSNDVYIIDYKGKEVLIPALKTVVKNIDIEAGTMVVDLPEGIIEDEV
jgi:16S rRNA processing protein RimM